MKRAPVLLGTLVTVGLTAACGHDPQPRAITSQSALQTAKQNLHTMVAGSSSFADLIGNNSVVSKAVPSMSGTQVTTTMQTTAQLADNTSARIFDDSNVETSEPTKIVLRLRSAQVCKSDDGSIDAQCASVLDQVPVRLSLVSYAENDVDVAILIGEERANPVTIYLHHDELAVQADLAGAKSAASDILAAMHESTMSLPNTMQGLVKLALHKNAENDFTASIAIESQVSIAGAVAQGPYDLEVAQANPAMSVRFDGNAREVTVIAAWNPVSVAFPINLFSSALGTSPDATGSLGLAIAGLTGKAVLGADSANGFRITGFGIGQDALRVTVDGAPVFSFDLNPTSGRQLDLGIGATLGGDLALDVSPELDAVATYAFGGANGKLGTVQPWMLDETLEILLAGAPKPSLLFNQANGAIQVTQGSLTLSSRAENKKVTVDTNMCVGSTNGNANADPIESVVAVSCPN